MDKMREQFEKWYSNRQQYGEAHKQELWETWKSSREHLNVELPEKYSYTQYDMDFVRLPAAARNEVIDEFVEILENAGVNYK